MKKILLLAIMVWAGAAGAQQEVSLEAPEASHNDRYVKSMPATSALRLSLPSYRNVATDELETAETSHGIYIFYNTTPLDDYEVAFRFKNPTDLASSSLNQQVIGAEEVAASIARGKEYQGIILSGDSKKCTAIRFKMASFTNAYAKVPYVFGRRIYYAAAPCREYANMANLTLDMPNIVLQREARITAIMNEAYKQNPNLDYNAIIYPLEEKASAIKLSIK